MKFESHIVTLIPCKVLTNHVARTLSRDKGQHLEETRNNWGLLNATAPNEINPKEMIKLPKRRGDSHCRLQTVSNCTTKFEKRREMVYLLHEMFLFLVKRIFFFVIILFVFLFIRCLFCVKPSNGFERRIAHFRYIGIRS